jgi:hypothetical protein
MATTRVSYAGGDGPHFSVPALVKAPTLIRSIVYKMLDQESFVGDILRDAGTTESGAFVYSEGTPLFVNDVTPIVNKGGEIPVTTAAVGTPVPGSTVKRAMGIEITEEDRDRNNYDAVNTQLTQLRNTFDRDWNAAFLQVALSRLSTFASAATAVVGGWGAGDATTANAQYIRSDLAKATQVIQLADADTSNGTGQMKFGFSPDTLVINPVQQTQFILSREVQQLFTGNSSAQNAMLADSPARRLPVALFGLTVWVTWQMPAGQALLLQRKRIGGIINEKPLTTTPLYRINQRQVWRSDTDRRSAAFIDQPKAGLLLTGLNGA